MVIEPIGLITIVLGLFALFGPAATGIYILVVSGLFGASAAVILTAMGGASIPPAHLLLGFVACGAVFRPALVAEIRSSLRFPQPGFWLAATVLYGSVSAYFFPRLFAGMTYVTTLARTDVGPGVVLLPLGPTSGNITQPIYLVGDLICFVAIRAFASTLEGQRLVAKAFIACVIGNLGFAVLDLLTFWTDTSYTLDFIRNANYRMLNDTVVLGFKRIVGSFTEASAFGGTTLGFFAFALQLWLGRVYSRLSLILAILSFVALVFSISSTAYGGAAITLLLLYGISVARVLSGHVTRAVMAFVFAIPLLVALTGVTLALEENIWGTIDAVLDKMIVNKMTSSSGVERAQWNRQAMTNFMDTYGMGAGVGSTRASSFPIAVLSGVGVIGAFTYGAFILLALFAPRRQDGGDPARSIQDAARAMCLAFLTGAVLAGTLMDLGLGFYMAAGLAAASPSPAPAWGRMGLAGRDLHPRYS